MPTTLGFLNQLPAPWAFALAALGLILSVVPVVWISFHRRRVLLARVDAQNLETECQHIQRIYELETSRKLGLREQDRLTLIATREQARLDRSVEAELASRAQLTHLAETTPSDAHRTAMPARQSAQAQVEKRAA